MRVRAHVRLHWTRRKNRVRFPVTWEYWGSPKAHLARWDVQAGNLFSVIVHNCRVFSLTIPNLAAELNVGNIINGSRHWPVLGLWQDEGDEAGCDGHGAKDEGGDDRADLGQRRHRRRQRASHLRHQRGGPNTSSPDSGGHQFSGVHVENCKAASCCEVSDQRENHDRPVAWVDVPLKAESEQEHCSGDARANLWWQ